MSIVKCLNCGQEFPLTRTHYDDMGLHTVCPYCDSSFDTDGEVELNDEQLARNDEIYNAAYDLCKVLLENEDMEWDMEYIGAVVEGAICEMLSRGHRVRYPGVLTDENGAQTIEEWMGREFLMVGKCVLAEDGSVTMLEKEAYGQGMIFKDEEAFLHKPDAPCYVPELSDDVFTRNDFLQIAEGDAKIAEHLFYYVDWQSPTTAMDEDMRDGEVARCEKCGKLFRAMMEPDAKCPHCEKEV